MKPRRLILISAVDRDSSGSEGIAARKADAPVLACDSSWARSRVGISEKSSCHARSTSREDTR